MSCGCYKVDRSKAANSLAPGESGRRRAVLNMKANARRRGMTWELTEDHVRGLMERNCFYCGSAPGNVSSGRTGDFVYSGIDRIENAVGYLDYNVVSCCFQCNTAKLDLSLDGFRDWVLRVAARFYDGSISRTG